MKQNARKLNLGKKTITRLNAANVGVLNGGSVVSATPPGTSVVVYTNGCQTDFTRPRTSAMTGTSVHP